MRSFLIWVVCLFAPFAFAAEALPKVAIQPLGKVRADSVEQLSKALKHLYAAEVVVLPPKELPASAFFRPRQRYRAEKLLDWLNGNTEAGYVKVIGITEADISTTKGEAVDWGIFGLGLLGGRPCVVSTFRLGREVPRAKMLERLGKVAGHEVGHTFGLDHCPVEGCLMRDAEGKVATVDGEGGELCEACRKRVPAAAPR